MRAVNIKTTLVSFLSIQDITLYRGINEHGKAEIKGYIKSSEAEKYRMILLDDAWMEIWAADETSENRIIFAGIVTAFSMQTVEHNCLLQLTIMTGSYLMDIIPKYRSFQDGNSEYNDLFEVLNAEYENVGMIGDRGIYEKLEEFFLQYYETDWKFAKRVISKCGKFLTPSIHRTGIVYSFGIPDADRHDLPERIQFEMQKDLKSYREKLQGGLAVSENDCIIVYFTDRDIYDLFDRIFLFGREMLVSKIESKYVGQELLHTYTLQSEFSIQTCRIFGINHNGISLPGVVADVKEDMVQVKLDNDGNHSQRTLRWFPFSTVYSSPDGTGWYFMPEIGDKVRLHIPEKNEEYAYVISAVHIRTPDERKNPDVKSLKTKYGKEIRFTPQSIVITNNAGTSIEVSDSSGINIISDKNVNISANEAISISSDSSSVTIAGDTDVTLQQSGASLTLDGDINMSGGDLRIH